MAIQSRATAFAALAAAVIGMASEPHPKLRCAQLEHPGPRVTEAACGS